MVSLWASHVHAECPIDPVAARLKQQGDTAIDAGEYALALSTYAKALGIETCPSLYYNRGRALQGLGRNAEALADFEQFRDSASTELVANVPRLDEMIGFVQRQVAEITVVCNVHAATLHVNEQALALPLKTPLRLDPNTVRLEITSPRHETWSTRVTLEAGEHREIVARLVPVDARGALVVNSPTTGANVTIDGRNVGVVPVELRLEPGAHTVGVERTGFEPVSSRVEVRTGERRVINLALDKTTEWYQSWWFWSSVGVVMATGAIVGVALTTETSPGSGDIPPGRIKMPLVVW